MCVTAEDQGILFVIVLLSYFFYIQYILFNFMKNFFGIGRHAYGDVVYIMFVSYCLVP